MGNQEMLDWILASFDSHEEILTLEEINKRVNKRCRRAEHDMGNLCLLKAVINNPKNSSVLEINTKDEVRKVNRVNRKNENTTFTRKHVDLSEKEKPMSSEDIKFFLNDKKVVKSPQSIQQQLEQIQHEKMLLLDQLAQFDVALCFSCRNKLPVLENKVERMNKRRLARLRELREICVRVTDTYNSEKAQLACLENELIDINKKTTELKSNIKNKHEIFKSLNDDIEEIKNEQNDLLELKCRETEKLEMLKKEIQKLQEQNEVYEINEDIFHVRNETDKLKKNLNKFRTERNELEAELISIVECTKLKETKLQNYKKELSEIRQDEESTRKAAEIATNERRKLKRIHQENLTHLAHLQEQIRSKQNEIEKDEEMLQKAKEIKKKTCEEQEKIRNELISLGDGTKRLRNMLNDYKSQRQECENQTSKHAQELSDASSQLDEIKLKLYETVQQIEMVEKQRQESKQLHETLRLRLLDEFTIARSKLRQLREERDNNEGEIERFLSPAARERKEIINQEKYYLVQADKEISELHNSLAQKQQCLIDLKKSISQVENEHEELNKKCEEEQSKLNNLKNENKCFEIVKNMEKSRTVLETVCARSETFTDNIYTVMKQFIKEFEESSDTLKNIKMTPPSIKTGQNNITIEDFMAQLKDHFIKYMDEHFGTSDQNDDNNKILIKKQETEIAKESDLLQSIIVKREQVACEKLAAESEMQKYVEDLQNLTKKMEDEKTKVLQLQAKNNEALLNQIELEKELNEITNKRQELEEKIALENERIKELHSRLDTVEIEKKEAESALNIINDSRIELENICDKYTQEIKQLRTEEQRKKNELNSILSEISQTEKDIITQRKRRIDMQNLFYQERVETIAEKQNYNQGERRKDSLEELAFRAKEGLKNPQLGKIMQNSALVVSPSSPQASSSSDEDLEKLLAVGKIKKIK